MLKPLRIYPTSEQAYIVRGMLADAGINATVQDTGMNSVFPSLDENSGGATLLVPAKDVEKAEELLACHDD